jgi:hypothetical protein
LTTILADGHLAQVEVDLQFHDADHGRLAKLAGDEGGVAGAAAAAGQNALGGQHAVHVIGLGLRANHDDLAAVFLGPTLGGVGVEGDHTDGRAGGDVEAAGDLGGLQRFAVELRVQEEVDLGRLHAPDGLFLW